MSADHPELILAGMKSCFGMLLATPGEVLSKGAADLQNIEPSKTKFGEPEEMSKAKTFKMRAWMAKNIVGA